MSKVLAELANSIRNRRRSPDVLSEHLHEALQDLNSAIKSQPCLFLGSNNTSANTNMTVDCRPDRYASSEVALPSIKIDISSILERRSKRVTDNSTESAERRVLRPTLSKIMITSLEFSEALPFAAFASLLVEMVARLELVIEEVEELGRAANFKLFSGENDIAMEVSCKVKQNESNRDMQMHVVSQSAE